MDAAPSGPDEIDAALTERVRARARPDGMAWLDAQLAAPDAAVRLAFPAVGRQVGRGGLDAPGDALALPGGDRIDLGAWRIDDAARVLLLRAAARRDPGGALALALDLYRGGDARERAGALRALSVLPGAEGDPTALPAVLDAMRASQGELFEAAVLDSPYASIHLPQHEWRKAVLKAVFVGFAIERVARLDARADAELAASLYDLVLEREAATRAVPPALWPVIALHPPAGLVGKLLGYLEHPAEEHRVAAARALARVRDPRAAALCADHAARDASDAVRAALAAAAAPEPS